MPSNLENRQLLSFFYRLASINVLSNLMVPLAGLINTAFLGHLHEIRYLAGVALTTVLFNYLYWTFGFLRMSTTGLTAQAIGRQDSDAALLVGLRNAVVALGLGTAILLLQWPLRSLGFLLLSATPEVKVAGQAYFDALIWGAPATLLNFVIVGWYLGRSQSSKVLLLSAVSNFSNVGLDALFIGQWSWQSSGAGAATALSQGLMLGVGLGLVGRDVLLPQLKRVGKQIWHPAAFRATMTLNQEILVRTFTLISTFAVFTNLSASLGTGILSANTLLLQVVTFAAYFIDGIAFATESLVGSLSTEKPELLKRLLYGAGASSLGLGLLIAVVFILAPRVLLQLLTNHADILTLTERYIYWLLPVLGFGSISYLLDGYFLGLTDGKLLRKSAVLAACGFAPVAIAAWFFQSVHLLWLALAVFMAGRAVTLGLQVSKTFSPGNTVKQV
jgi:multidrug resistance protein, MATE family